MKLGLGLGIHRNQSSAIVSTLLSLREADGRGAGTKESAASSRDGEAEHR